jgi:thiol:disulfide interchange protein
VKAKPLVQQFKVEYQYKVPFIDCDSNNPDTGKLAAKYSVVYVPTLVFLNKKGAVSNKLVGTIDEKSLKENLEKIIK